MLVTEKVLKVLKEEHISIEELQQMLTEAAFTSIRHCNLRYFQWLFLVKHVGPVSTLVDMQRVDLIEIGRGENRMLEDHEPCLGEGCRECGWAGVISRAIEDATASSLDK